MHTRKARAILEAALVADDEADKLDVLSKLDHGVAEQVRDELGTPSWTTVKEHMAAKFQGGFASPGAYIATTFHIPPWLYPFVHVDEWWADVSEKFDVYDGDDGKIYLFAQ